MRAPVAQLDRASASGVEGRGFESRRVYHLSKIPVKNEKTAFANKFADCFSFFTQFRLLRTRGICLAGCLRFAQAHIGECVPSLCSGSLRFACVESRQKVPF